MTRYYASIANTFTPYKDKTERKIRIKTEGSVIPTTAVKHSLTLDCYATLAEYSRSESDGLGFEEMTWRPFYDTGVSTDFLIALVCKTAAIT
jgi:hypothetical protein